MPTDTTPTKPLASPLQMAVAGVVLFDPAIPGDTPVPQLRRLIDTIVAAVEAAA